jgi:hypothetical protein
MSKPSTLAELRAELIEIDEKLAEFRVLSARRERLSNLIRQWEALYADPRAKKGHQKRATQPPSLVEISQNSTTSSYAIEALSKKGPLALGDLLQEARALGWAGSGRDLIDKKRLYAAMFKNHKFSKGTDGRWRLAETKEKAS